MKQRKEKIYQIDRYELVDAILASEIFEDSDMSDTLMKLYTSMLLQEQKQDIFISRISVPSTSHKKVLQYLDKSKMALG